MNDWLAVQNTLFEMRHVDILSVILKSACIAFVFVCFFGIALEFMIVRLKRKTLLFVVPLFLFILLLANLIPDLPSIMGLPAADVVNNGYVKYSAQFHASAGFIFIPLCLAAGMFFFTLFHIRKHCVASISGAVVRLMLVVLGSVAGGCVAALL